MIEKLTYTVTEAAALIGISRNTAYEAVRRGELPSIKICGRIIIPIASLQKKLEEANVTH